MAEERKGGLVVSDRPQVSVELIVSTNQVEISVARIGDDFQTVEFKEISFPAECAEEVANAILGLVR